MSASTSCAPSRPNRRALARPMPVLAPVITAALPFKRPSARGTDVLASRAEPVDAELHLVPRDEVARRALAESYAGGGSGGDDVAGQERHELADVTDERRHVEDELAGRAALLGRAVHLEPQAQVVHVADLVRRSEEGPERGEAVAALALHPLAAVLELEGPFGVIVVEHVAGDVPQRLVPLDIRRAAPDYDRQLHLPVQLGAVSRDEDVVVGTADRAGRLAEEDRLVRDRHARLASVVAIIEAHAHDLARSAQRRPQPHAVGAHGRGRALPFEPARPPLEAVGSRECRVI